jgi:L-cysteine S-thiosulfotransferase
MVRQHHGRNVRLIGLVAGALCAFASIGHGATRARLSVPSGMPRPLTARLGDARRGKAVAVNSDRGNCIACHKMPIFEIPVGGFGDLGPPLDAVGSRLSVAELRLRIANPKLINPDTIMPAYQVVKGLNRVGADYVGRPILSAQDVDDLVAYLASLK